MKVSVFKMYLVNATLQHAMACMLTFTSSTDGLYQLHKMLQSGPLCMHLNHLKGSLAHEVGRGHATPIGHSTDGKM